MTKVHLEVRETRMSPTQERSYMRGLEIDGSEYKIDLPYIAHQWHDEKIFELVNGKQYELRVWRDGKVLYNEYHTCRNGRLYAD